jgi:hypothetical protein
MSTLIIIEDHPGNRAAMLAKEYFPTDGDAFDGAWQLLRQENVRRQKSPDQISALLSLRIERDDGSMLDDATVRHLASQLRH